MKAAQARRLANNVKNGKVKSRGRTTELDEVLRLISIEAGIGLMFLWIDVDMFGDQDTATALEKLGYTVEVVQKSPTSRPKIRLSWERKAA